MRDAGYCASPLSGQGTTLAVVGAYVLAGELAADADHRAAFARYEDALRSFVRANQELALTNGELVAQGADGVEEQIDDHWAASAAIAIALPDYAA